MKILKHSLVVISLLSIWSCQKDEISVEDNNNVETAIPQSKTINIMGITNFPVIEKDGKYYNGDIEVLKSQVNTAPLPENMRPQSPEKGALALGRGYVRKWPNNTVVYRIDNLSSTLRANLKGAMDEWTSKTGIKFVERTNQSNYVTVFQEKTCNCGYATLGQAGNQGVISLGARSSVPLIVHELGHTLGFIHEQNRSDRDDYVKINFQNIAPENRDQFFKSDNALSLTDKLDLESTMMYGAYTFSANRQPTIVDLSGNPIPRKSGMLSDGDIAGAKQAYPVKDDTDNGGDNPVTPPTTPKDVCDGIAEWSPRTAYRVGDKVTFEGNLFERDFSGWNFLRRCGAVTSNDICSGVNSYNGNDNSYSVGDKVIFRGDLYRRVNGGWVKEGQCGS